LSIYVAGKRRLGLHTVTVFTGVTAARKDNGLVPSEGFEWYFYGTVTAGLPTTRNRLCCFRGGLTLQILNGGKPPLL
jgi:hypothetical protein